MPFLSPLPISHTFVITICCVWSFHACCLCCACHPAPVGTLIWVRGWLPPCRFWGGKEGKGFLTRCHRKVTQRKGTGRPLSTFSVSNFLTFYYLSSRGAPSVYFLRFYTAHTSREHQCHFSVISQISELSFFLFILLLTPHPWI